MKKRFSSPFIRIVKIEKTDIITDSATFNVYKTPVDPEPEEPRTKWYGIQW